MLGGAKSGGPPVSAPVREFKREACPICGHTGWCGRREDGLVLCKRPPMPREVPGFIFRGMASDSTTGMYVEAGREFTNGRGNRANARPSPRETASSKGEKVRSEWLGENYPRLVAQLTTERRQALADELKLPVSALDALSIGWWPDRRWWNPETRQEEGEPGCWTFPECDSLGRVIGLGLRWPAGHKGQLAGGRRGLILPTGWGEFSDPVIVAEGPSDVLAGRAVGLSIIGRPSNGGGADLLAQACRDRRVIVLGENDRKPDGRWPGKEGAEVVARKLEAAWGRPVPVALPPEEAKDLRAWFVERRGQVPEGSEGEDLAAIGHKFLTAIRPPNVLLFAASPRSRRSSRVVVKAFRWDSPPDAGPIHTDKIDIDDTKSRARFASAVAVVEATTDVEELQTRLMKLEIPEARTGSRPVGDRPNPQPSGGLTDAGQRPQIQSNERQLRDIRDDALVALKAANDPPHLFSRAGGVARIACGCNDRGERVPEVQQLDADAMRGELTNAADWVVLRHSREHGDFLVADLPPLVVARDLLALPQLDLPPLVGVITCPTFAADGTLIVENGYHATSGLWHHRTLAALEPIAASPSQAAVSTARDALLGVVAEFPFVDAASRAHALALMLLPFVRSLIMGPTPLHGVDAPTAGTGKDLLVKAALWPALGYAIGPTTAPKDPDEWRKKITSALVEGGPAILWGNVGRRLDSEHLAAVLTDVEWKDRQLGQTRVLSLLNRAVWAATGNNLAFSRELTRRVVWIRLDAKIEMPEQRTGFRHPDLLLYVREERARLVHAALTLVQAWLAAGRPAGGQVMGSFESYTQTLGGILDVAGITGFLGNADTLRRQADTETNEWREFVGAWWERWGDAWVGVADLGKLLWAEDGERSGFLGKSVSSEKQRGALTQLGRRLSSKRDCVMGTYRLLAGNQSDRCGRMTYRLVPNDPQTSTPPDGSLHEVCTEVCTPKSCDGNELEESADLRRHSGHPSSHTGVNTRAHAPTCDISPARTRGTGKKYAEVCTSPQTLPDQQVTSADFPQTLLPPPGKSAPVGSAALVSRRVHWLSEECDHLPASVIDLAVQRDGWTPGSWRDHLLYLAERCQEDHADRAAELRQAADVMIHPRGGLTDEQCRRCDVNQ